MYRSVILKKIDDRHNDRKALLVIIAFIVLMAINTLITFRIAWDGRRAYDEVNMNAVCDEEGKSGKF